jgi:hypothetical protein
MTKEPTSYPEWIDLFKSRGAFFDRYENLPSPTEEFRVLLRHDIDLFDVPLLERCRSLELELETPGTWLFLPPRDKRYGGTDPSAIARYIRRLKSDGFEIGYHINAWEAPGTYDLVEDPLARLDDDLSWFQDVLGEPVRVALAHGIPRHKDVASNFSMFDALASRGVAMLDVFIIQDGGLGRRIPHFGHRSSNPMFPAELRITYTSDSGGPLRREWDDLDSCLGPGRTFILGMHCGNYDIERLLGYQEAKVYATRYGAAGTTG